MRNSNDGLSIATCRWLFWKLVALLIIGRVLNALGIEVKLLPAAYIRAYVKRNKTDAADALRFVGGCPLR